MSRLAHEYRQKLAGELRDHDVLAHHGLVDWTVGAPKPLEDQILVHVHSGTERRSYTLLLPKNLVVDYERA
jgi:hypothetical protein